MSATGSNILWYTTATAGTGSSSKPTPSTATAGTTLFYASQSISGCESPTRFVITVNVTAVPSAPGVTTSVVLCQGSPSVQLSATGSNLLWYSASSGGTGSATAPTASASTLGSTNYYVSQTNIGSSNCEGPRAQITVNIVTTPAAPTVTSPLNYCQNQTASPLTAGGSNLLWYASATGGTGSSTAPVPSTSIIGSSTYYVSQSAGTCESPRLSITVNVATTPAAPTVMPQVNYCVGAPPTALTASGTNIKWYTTAAGGTASATAPTPSTTTVGPTSYFVSQSTGTCESPRAEVMVVVNAIPAAPMVGPTVNYCKGETPMNFIVSGTNLLWYVTATNGIGNSIAPIISSTTVGTNTYYVSQSSAVCEGPRSSITVNVNPTPVAPTVPPTQTYCQNAPTNPLVVSGNNLKWYTQATGGTASTTTPVVSSANAGTTIYYVSQTTGNCESLRASITANITATPAAPTVSSIINFCPNQTVGPLADSVTGTNLLWYTTATGGTASNTAPIPNTTVAGTLNYYVAQTNSCGEGARANIQVIITATRAAPITLSTTAITLNSATLNWNAQSGSFFTVEYKPAAAATWNVAATGIQTNSYNLSGLTIGSTYQWRITANCAAVGSGNVSSVQTFTTASRNNKITIIKDGIGLKISPNPVSTSAIIDYIVPGSGEVTFNILDQNGRSVKKFSDGIKVAGQYQKDLLKEFKGMAKGGYFIRLEQSSKSIGLHFVKF